MDLALNQTSHRPQPLRAAWAELGLPVVRNLAEGSTTIERRRQGRIVVADGRLLGVAGRWWPQAGSLFQIWLDKKLRGVRADRCEVYYHQPLGSPTFLTLSYVRSSPGTTLSTLYVASLALDEIAKIRATNAIVANVANARISARLLKRWGWEAHCLDWPGRHFIKRFYGEYPEIPDGWRPRLGL